MGAESDALGGTPSHQQPIDQNPGHLLAVQFPGQDSVPLPEVAHPVDRCPQGQGPQSGGFRGQLPALNGLKQYLVTPLQDSLERLVHRLGFRVRQGGGRVGQGLVRQGVQGGW